MRTFLTAILAVTSGLACQSDRDNDRFTDRAVGPDGSAPFDLVEDLRIDGSQADLVPIHTIAVDGRGMIAVAQRQDHAIRFFDAAGVALGSLGRDGEGPGEFRDVTRLGWLADTLWVLDMQLHRLTLVDSARRFVRTVLSPGASRANPVDSIAKPAFFLAIPFAMYPDGTTLAYATTTDFDAVARVSAGNVTESVLSPLSTRETARTVRAGGATASPPFPNSPRLGVSPTGHLIAIARAAVDGPDAGQFTVTVLRAGGDTVFARRYNYQAEPIPKAVADSAVEARAAQLPPDLAAAYRKAPVPAVYPPLVAITVGADGMVWIQMRDRQTNHPYFVVDRDGRPGGEVVLDRSSTIAAVTGTFAWVLERDANDVQSIVRYRLKRR
jgi:hypothetical protein